MRDSKKSDKYALLDELFNLFLDDKYRPGDDELFLEWDIDINGIVNKNINLFRKLRTITKAELNEIKHKRIYNFLTKLQEGLKSKTDNYGEITEEIISKPIFADLQILFRNLEKISDKDKESIVKDAKLLELLDSIEEEYNEKLEDGSTNRDS